MQMNYFFLWNSVHNLFIDQMFLFRHFKGLMIFLNFNFFSII